MESVERETFRREDEKQEYRVQVTSKKKVIEQTNKYKEVLKTVLDGQPDGTEEATMVLLQELLANFEVAVQDNVLVNGRLWEESDVEAEDEGGDLESILDDAIVEATRRRRTFPRRILSHVVHGLKAERRILGLYETAVPPQEVRDPVQESIMNDVSAAAPQMIKQAVQVVKSINTLQQQAEGLREIVFMKPSQVSIEMHREVFASSGQSDAAPPPASGEQRNRQPITCGVEEAASSEGYVTCSKKGRSCEGADTV
ncbi:kinetochore-associated protein NSL1 homolog [Brachyistius frenatus]|uniref:kinetochore-associated protein NSL1 homolog n=1 Tax=Brachyistius frenatus TaxID=100188 RepID=UPI0037E858A5